MSAVTFVGLEREATSLSAAWALAQRRLVEVARAVVGNPRLVLLDEPAAGLPDEETEPPRRADPAHPRARPVRS